MVSITFDEFHAIRNRQRATANADAAADAAAAVAAATTETAAKSAPSTSAGAANNTAAAEESTNKAVKPSSNATARSTFSPSESASYSVASHEEEGDADDRAAPASGSASLSMPGRATARRRRPATSETATSAAISATEKRTDRLLKQGRQQEKSAIGFGRLSAASLGRFVEMFDVQVAVVSIIFLDLVASTVQLLPLFQRAGEADEKGGGGDEEGSTGTWVIRLIMRLLQSFTGFTIILFAIEVVLLLAAFRGKFFRHLGYVLDFAVVSVCLFQEMAGMGKGVRLLGALRVWRVARVMNTALLSADAAHDDTLDKVRLLEKRTQDLDIEKRRLQETIRREIDARKRVDKMLQGYKDEVETLNEALKIAAMDIAGARVPLSLVDGTADDAKDGKIVGDDGRNKNPGSTSTGSDEKNRKPGLIPNDSDTASNRSSSTASGKEGREGGGLRSGGDQGRDSPSTSRSSGRIYVLQDGTFQTQ